jgi:parallel beta-helix repeat protein
VTNGANDNDAFDVLGSSAVTIRGLHVTNALGGVYSDSPRTTVQDSIFDGAGGEVNDAIIFDPPASQGKALKNTIVDASTFGIIAIGSRADIEGNTISRAGQVGIAVGPDVSGAVVRHNVLANNGIVGIVLSAASGSQVSENVVNANGAAGIDVVNGSTGNAIGSNTAKGNLAVGLFNDSSSTGNAWRRNTAQGSGIVDAEDDSVGGGTAGTANTWAANRCDVSFPLGLCSQPATLAAPRAGTATHLTAPALPTLAPHPGH